MRSACMLALQPCKRTHCDLLALIRSLYQPILERLTSETQMHPDAVLGPLPSTGRMGGVPFT